MLSYKIIGSKPLRGEIAVQGSKNSVLPILAATLLIDGESIIHNCPNLSDVDVAVEILKHIGCKVKRENNTIIISAENIINHEIPDDLMEKMRSSVMFLGPVLARCKKTKMTFPGGCELGARPIDLHLLGMEHMGAIVTKEAGSIVCKAQELKGSEIHLSFPSVGATENIIMAAVKAHGKTRIINAACEPEILDLQNFLNRAGFNVLGAGTSVIEIHGRKKSQKTVEYTVMSDRIVTLTYLAAGALTGGKIKLLGTSSENCAAGISVLKKSGIDIHTQKNEITLDMEHSKIRSVAPIKTMPHPGFPTDAQSIFMTLMSVAEGTCVFVENIFDNRFRHVPELCKMGADIKVIGKVCVVSGVQRLFGANVKCTDLRGGAAMVLAGLCADGMTEVSDIYHIDRGYDSFESNLSELGADIIRI